MGKNVEEDKRIIVIIKQNCHKCINGAFSPHLFLVKKLSLQLNAGAVISVECAKYVGKDKFPVKLGALLLCFSHSHGNLCLSF